jgi:hypothetical protein
MYIQQEHFHRVGGVVMYEFRHVKGHIECYINGKFAFSADTKGEAWREMRDRECGKTEDISLIVAAPVQLGALCQMSLW